MRFPRLGEPVEGRCGDAAWPRAPEAIRLPRLAPGGRPWPGVSVVTPSLNQAVFLEQAILSIAHQGYPSVEHIVVDGASSDGTRELLARYGEIRWSSAPDRGQAHALNQGFARANGEILGWLNADDLYEPGALARVAEVFLARPEIDVVYGDCYYLYEDGEPRELRLVRSRPFDLDALLNEGCYVPQPATFLRRASVAGAPLDETLRFALDYEYWLRLARKGLGFHYLPVPLATFRVTSSSKSGAELERFWAEVRRVSLAYGGRRLSLAYRRHLQELLARRLPRSYAALKRAWLALRRVGRRSGE